MTATLERHRVERQHVLVTWPGAAKWHVPALPEDGSCPWPPAPRCTYLCGLSQLRDAERTVRVAMLDDPEYEVCLGCTHYLNKTSISRVYDPEGGSQ